MGEDDKVMAHTVIGTSVETALTNEQVEDAIAMEAALGLRDGECAFLAVPDTVSPAIAVHDVKTSAV